MSQPSAPTDPTQAHSQSSSRPPTSALAVAALITSILCFPIGLVLSIVAMIHVDRARGALGGKGFAIAGLAFSAGITPIAILVAIAVPNFITYACRSKQAEAKTNLRMLAIAEDAYRAEHGTYSSSLSEIRFDPDKTLKLRYDYSIIDASAETFRAEARSIEETFKGDTWLIDEKGGLVNTANACTL